MEAKASFRVVEIFRAYLGEAGEGPTEFAEDSRWDGFPRNDIMQRIAQSDNRAPQHPAR